MSRGPSRVSFSPSLPSVGRDVDGFFARVLASLPAPLVLALPESELDVATTLRDYPRMDALELQGLMKEEGYSWEQDSHFFDSLSLTYGHPPLVRPVGWMVPQGGDPRTDHANSPKGGDPKTDHETLVTGGDPTTDHAFLGATGSDPRTDLAFSGISACFSPQGEAGSQTAKHVLQDLPDSASLVDPELRDGLPSPAAIMMFSSGGDQVQVEECTELATPKLPPIWTTKKC